MAFRHGCGTRIDYALAQRPRQKVCNATSDVCNFFRVPLFILVNEYNSSRSLHSCVPSPRTLVGQGLPFRLESHRNMKPCGRLKGPQDVQGCPHLFSDTLLVCVLLLLGQYQFLVSLHVCWHFLSLLCEAGLPVSTVLKVYSTSCWSQVFEQQTGHTTRPPGNKNNDCDTMGG